ncbi:NIPSNAP family protein [Streptomyces sp. NBC_00209]|uniref:NIPSNAP family protein n=1 Tax=Streptomyces sp. NBC_00209 TaxID=2975682 RepID=UPI0032487740
MSIVELRQYTLHPGARETLIELFEREFVTGQEATGITVGGRFRDLGDPGRFVRLRACPDMAHRRRALEAFYDGQVWRRHRDAANATMAAGDDVLLLRGPGYVPPPDATEVRATICHPPDTASFTAYATRHLTPSHAPHRTEHAENDFPRLPIRTGEEARVWFGPSTPPPWPCLRLRLEPVHRTGRPPATGLPAATAGSGRSRRS